MARLGRGRGVGPGATRSARTLLWRLRPGGVDVTSRRALENPIEARRHPLGVVAVLVVIVIIGFALIFIYFFIIVIIIARVFAQLFIYDFNDFADNGHH